METGGPDSGMSWLSLVFGAFVFLGVWAALAEAAHIEKRNLDLKNRNNKEG